jgi:hypothetical protein
MITVEITSAKLLLLLLGGIAQGVPCTAAITGLLYVHRQSSNNFD